MPHVVIIGYDVAGGYSAANHPVAHNSFREQQERSNAPTIMALQHRNRLKSAFTTPAAEARRLQLPPRRSGASLVICVGHCCPAKTYIVDLLERGNISPQSRQARIHNKQNTNKTSKQVKQGRTCSVHPHPNKQARHRRDIEIYQAN